MFDVTALGEILIDFTPAGFSDRGNTLFERNPGGAPANLAVCVSRLGGSSAFIGKAGDDMFGKYLKATLKNEKVDDSGLVLTGKSGTTLAFVDLDENGERNFSFYRDGTADTELSSVELPLDIIRNSRFFHFGSLSLTHKHSRNAAIRAVNTAASSHVNISYDPNLRPGLWKSLPAAKRRILSVMKLASIVKLSGEELTFLTGEKSPDRGSDLFIRKYKTPILLVTMGKEGVFAYYSGKKAFQGAYTGLEQVDATGAGDAFLGAFLYSFLHEACMDVRYTFKAGMELCLRFACAAAALSVTRKGAIPAMPYREEVIRLLERF